MIAAMSCLYAGCFALAAGQSQHGGRLFPRRSPARLHWLRWPGWLLVAAALGLLLRSMRPALAVLTWIGLLPLVGGVLALVLSSQPRLARIGLAVALAGGVAGLL